MSAQRICGTLAAAVTPLRADGEQLDEEAFGPLLDFYRHSGLDGVMMLGTTGEGILLDRHERERVAELAVAGAGPLRVIVHCGAQTTAQAQALAAHAAEAGAAAVSVIGPPYFPFAPDELAAHFAAAAAACAPLPFYLYEYADRTGYTLPVAVVEELRETAANLVGLKVSDAPFERLAPYLDLGLDIFTGAEGLIRQALERGAVGAVSGVAAAFPEAVAALVEDPTAERGARVESLRLALSAHPFQAAVKATLAFRGVPVRRDVRAPLRPLARASLEHLRAELERLAGSEMIVPSL